MLRNTSLSCQRQNTPEWQAAIEVLLLVAEHDGPPMFVRIGVMRALNRHVERVFDPSRKDKHWGTTEVGAGSMIDVPRRNSVMGRRTAHQAINLSLSLFDCHRAAYRCYAGFRFAIADSDFPSPTIAFGQLNDGVFHSSVFHRISSA
jgi:hypothetical protein